MDVTHKRVEEIIEWIKEEFKITAVEVEKDFKSHEFTFKFQIPN